MNQKEGVFDIVQTISTNFTYLSCQPNQYYVKWLLTKNYCKVPKIWDAKKLRCKLQKIQTKTLNLMEFRQKGANGVANSEDSDQTAPLGAV